MLNCFSGFISWAITGELGRATCGPRTKAPPTKLGSQAGPRNPAELFNKPAELFFCLPELESAWSGTAPSPHRLAGVVSRLSDARAGAGPRVCASPLESRADAASRASARGTPEYLFHFHLCCQTGSGDGVTLGTRPVSWGESPQGGRQGPAPRTLLAGGLPAQ